MKKTNCYFYFDHYDMGARIPCCTFIEYPLGKCPCDECTNYLPKKEVSKIVREYLKNKESDKEVCNTCRSAEPKTGEWIPVKFRPLTDEEQEEYPDYCYMADCSMPDDGEEILVSTKYGRVEKDECGFDDGFYLDSGCDWQTDIVAWMPLPKPYKEESEEE